MQPRGITTIEARRQAQRLRRRCDEHGVAVGFIPGLVVIGGNATLVPVEVMSGMWATDLAHLTQALAAPRRSRPLNREDVVRLMALLDLGDDVPDNDALAAAGFAAAGARGTVPGYRPAGTPPPARSPGYRAAPIAYGRPARPAWATALVVVAVLVVAMLAVPVVVAALR